MEMIDFSKIEVHLLDEKLKLVDKSVCASNGFFLIPVYQRKKFTLKVESQLDLQFSKIKINNRTQPIGNWSVGHGRRLNTVAFRKRFYFPVHWLFHKRKCTQFEQCFGYRPLQWGIIGAINEELRGILFPEFEWR